MKLLSLTNIALVVVAAYIAHTCWTMYGLWNPTQCKSVDSPTCLLPYKPKNPKWEIKVYCNSRAQPTSYPVSELIWQPSGFTFDQPKAEKLTVNFPLSARRNGTLYLHVVLNDPSTSRDLSLKRTVAITHYMKPVTYANLISSDANKKTEKPVAHWRTKVNIHVMNPPFNFDRNHFPSEIGKYFKLIKNRYLPVLFIDELGFRSADSTEINPDTRNGTLDISYSPISIGKLRLWTTLMGSMAMMRELGFSEEDTEQIRGLFTDTNIWLLSLTFFVSTFHLLFDFLAFKHDIHYWRKRDTMEGLSMNTVLYRCISTIIIFFYLLEEQSSLLVLVPIGIGSVIEIWKVTKALKVSVTRSGWRISIQLGASSKSEVQTKEYDQQAIKYLSYLLYPLSVAGAVYSLLYMSHRSWYSWAIKSLVNGVYAFGFLFMLPQLFVNYKLKSVAHLPWKSFMYKAFNTFIDDLFAFIIKMPTSHRVACFRDDIVFFCYLYQRWLYPVDKTRPNEYGAVYDETKKEK